MTRAHARAIAKLTFWGTPSMVATAASRAIALRLARHAFACLSTAARLVPVVAGRRRKQDDGRKLGGVWCWQEASSNAPGHFFVAGPSFDRGDLLAVGELLALKRCSVVSHPDAPDHATLRLGICQALSLLRSVGPK
jgi:hypothetical protein